MVRDYRYIQQYEKELLELKVKGITQREITERLGFTKEQVKGFFKRHNKKERRIAAGIGAFCAVRTKWSGSHTDFSFLFFKITRQLSVF